MTYSRTSEKELTYLGIERDLTYYSVSRESWNERTKPNREDAQETDREENP